MERDLAISIARTEEQMRFLTSDAVEAKESRKETYKSIEDIRSRLATVETQLASAAPTLAEFVVIKHKINGAGIFGKWLWAFVAFAIGSIAAVNGWWSVLRGFFSGTTGQ